MSFKQNAVDSIVTRMMAAEYRRLDESLALIIRKNVIFGKAKSTAFLYNGSFYCQKDYLPYFYPKDRVHALSPEIEKDMEDYLEDKKQVLLDEKIFRQILHVLLKDATTTQDVKNMLPDFLSADLTLAFNPVRTIPFEDCHTTLAIQQTNKLLTQMQIYSAGRLLY